MQSFKSHDEIQSEYKRKKKELFNKKMKIQQEKELMEKKVLEIAQESDKINRELNENAYHNELKEWRRKLPNYLKIYILSKRVLPIINERENINQYPKKS